MNWLKKRTESRAKRPTLSLPLAQAEGNVMLVVMIAVLVFLSGLVWLAGGAAQKMTGRWNHTLSNELTIEIPPNLEDSREGMTSDQRIQSVKEILAQYNAVTNVQTVEREALQKILNPWLGDISSFPDLPLPTLIEVSLHPDHGLKFDDLKEQIDRAVPGVQVIAHYAWAGEVQRLANTISVIAWGVMLFIGFVLLLVMIFAARARLAMFAPEVEVLHTLGATDGFVAGEFSSQAFRLSFWGALIGLLALLAVLGQTLSFVFPEIFSALKNMSGDLSVLQDWRMEMLGLFMLPIAIVILNTLAARMAVLSALRRLT
ncbi:MAG TPA: hypothetical protein PKW15_00685 [Alphaproteobacteria bacterium]|nr:hypothetical protein [Rhodospirillaceae bacterium]HRJ11739.1 hypothetical protein [Alphaproteobacteria bacterium]